MLTIDYKGHPKKPFKQLIKEYSTSVLVLDDVLLDDDTYSAIYQDMLDLLKYGLEYKQVREFPINFVFHPEQLESNDKKKAPTTIYTLQCRHFLSNMVIWYAYMKMERTDLLDESRIVDWKDKSVQDIGDIIDNQIIPAYDGDFHALNAIIDEIIFHIRAISDTFCLIFGYSASIWDIWQAEKANPEIHDLMYGEFDSTRQAKEIEDDLNDMTMRLIRAFGESDSDLKPLIKSGKNLTPAQVKEIFLHVGYKADISSRTIPWFIESNLLRTGINTPAGFYTGAAGGRKALMDMKLSMSKPGALSKKMNNNATTVMLRKDHETCNSTRPVYYRIKNETFLKLLDGRTYFDERGEKHVLNGFTDVDLIGKVVGFKSPCTCTSVGGICRECYGERLFDINDDLFSQGSFAATVNYSIVAAPDGDVRVNILVNCQKAQRAA